MSGMHLRNRVEFAFVDTLVQLLVLCRHKRLDILQSNIMTEVYYIIARLASCSWKVDCYHLSLHPEGADFLS